MLKKLVFSFIMIIFAGAILSTSIDAKLLPRAKPPTPSTVVGNPQRVQIKVKMRGDRRAIIATFTNLKVASGISYALTYDANGITQGAGGSVDPSSSEPVVRELLFGSCSAGICRYDSNIKNAKFVVTTTLKTGKKVVKTFRLNPRI